MDKVERIHFSKQPFRKLLKMRYKQDPHDNFKPHGFWYSAGDAWLDWCKSEMPQWVGRHAYTLDIGNANILRLDDVYKIKQFTKEFGRVPYPEAHHVGIDWSNVAEKWDGVEIIPYQWSIRLDMDTFWYYGWDVASGCVWNLEKVSIASRRKIMPSGLNSGVRACRDEVLDGGSGGKCRVADAPGGLA